MVQHTFDVVLYPIGHMLSARVKRPVGPDPKGIEFKRPELLPVLAKEVIEANISDDAGVPPVSFGDELIE